MANHEINTTCAHCGEEYDLRLLDACPQCGTPHAPTKASQRSVLLGLGFQATEYFDRDFADFDNIKVVEYRKDIGDDCAIVYSEYHVAEAPGEFELRERSAELAVGDCSVELVFTDTAELLGLMAKLKKMVKH